MIPLSKKNGNTWAIKPRSSTETFWASYSDLMAGLLMIFTLTTVITLLDIGERFVEPTKPVREWNQIVKNICEELKGIENVQVDCKTGTLKISDKSLQFGFNETKVSDEAKELLREVVPKYLTAYKTAIKRLGYSESIKMIEISGHTDRKDKDNANPRISSERAGKILKFLINDPSKELKRYRELLKAKAVAAGYAATRLPKSCGEREKCDEARRVEIAIKLDEAGILREIVDILKKMKLM